ncbi:hypothetical protein D9615_003953 [Tricholomella constricta]|uniref:Uncharacterized protein n=1 Tax=Tricholomella constricta TaxID=117010 RepID=A0A8H5M4V6_9AGAR|nr:hypothetical protein D9615_003953 [Tricholomella constricta]
MTSPQQLVIASLNVALETCSAALHVTPTVEHHSDSPDLSVLRNDFTSILSLLHGSTTKLSLALNPASPTYSASLTPLKDISEQISAVSHCVRLLDHNHGLSLNQEFTSVANDVIQSVRSLLQTFLDIETSGNRTSTGKAGDKYMIRIGTVHEIINNARSGLSKDNLASVQKKLAQDHDSLEDGLQEVGEMVTDHGSAIESADGDGWDDDGWGELGMDSRRRMDSDELERAKKVHAILRLSTLLHKRIMKDILSPPPHYPSKLPSTTVQNLDSLPRQSSALLVASDDLVSTLYTPQNPSNVLTELASFTEVINNLRSTLLLLLQEPTLVEHIEAMTLQGTSVPLKDPKKWFESCFVQIQKAMENLESTLNIDR